MPENESEEKNEPSKFQKIAKSFILAALVTLCARANLDPNPSIISGIIFYVISYSLISLKEQFNNDSFIETEESDVRVEEQDVWEQINSYVNEKSTETDRIHSKPQEDRNKILIPSFFILAGGALTFTIMNQTGGSVPLSCIAGGAAISAGLGGASLWINSKQ